MTKQAPRFPVALLAILAAACGPGAEGPPAIATASAALPACAIPAKTVVLTFDDGLISHLQFVAPLLKERGFGATFFITHQWMENREYYLDFAQVAELARMGFEVGSHSYDHLFFSRPENAPLLPEQVRRIEEGLAAVGVEKPVSFAWPGNAFGPESLLMLREAGYLFGRRGPEPECPWNGAVPAAAYDPGRHDRLLIPASVVTWEWPLDHFRKAIERAVPGRAVVLQFHGVPDVPSPNLSTDPEKFRAFVEELTAGGYNVIALRDLARYGADKVPLRDPLANVRYPQRY